MTSVHESQDQLLGPADPAPVEIVNPAATLPLVLTCEHAGRAVPERLGDLGVPPAAMERHIAYDLGIEPVARRLASALDACLVLQPYSRLVIDCNRPLRAPDLVPPLSDGVAVSANAALSPAERLARYRAIHRPFHRAVGTALGDRTDAGRRPALIALHSFTPCMNGQDRPWQIGLCCHRDRRLAEQLMAAMLDLRPELCAAFNQPYAVDDLSDFTIPIHGERRRHPHVLIELRQDLIADGAGQRLWADLLAAAIGACLAPAGVPRP